MLDKVRQIVLPKIEASGPIEASIVDDTMFPKKGRHSVGVARQYCGQLGKQDNCQAVVSVSIANHHASLPIAHRLNLPESWANDSERRKAAKVPQDVAFKTKQQIALDQLREAQAAGVGLGTVLADAGYGNDSQFRDGITQLGLLYVVGIQSNVLMWNTAAVVPVPGVDGRKPSRLQVREQQMSAKELALSQPPARTGVPGGVWQTVTWRQDGAAFTSRFACWRVRPVTRSDQPAEAWLIVEWPEAEAEPTKYWLSSLPAEISFEDLIDRAKLRWQIERDYQDLKQEVGLGHYEGRGCRGFHHHVTLCIAAYGFLIAERAIFPPSGLPGSRRSKAPGVPRGARSNRAPAASRTAYSKLDHNAQAPAGARAGRAPSALPMLRRA